MKRVRNKLGKSKDTKRKSSRWGSEKIRGRDCPGPTWDQLFKCMLNIYNDIVSYQNQIHLKIAIKTVRMLLI